MARPDPNAVRRVHEALHALGAQPLEDDRAVLERIEARVLRACRARGARPRRRRLFFAGAAVLGFAAAAGATVAVMESWRVVPFDERSELLLHTDDDPLTPDFGLVIEAGTAERILEELEGGGTVLTLDGAGELEDLPPGAEGARVPAGPTIVITPADE